MRAGFIWLLSLVLLVCAGCQRERGSPVPAPSAAGGGGSDFGNGGDDVLPENASAWFLGAGRPVKACVVVAPGYGHTAVELKAMIERAFGTWRRYIEDKHIQQERGPDTPPLALDFVVSAACAGDESLRFLFGVIDAEATEALSHYDRPSAFAHRLNFDRSAGWSRGIVWIAPPSRFLAGDPDPGFERHLTGLLLHEIGHVLGNGHVLGTIMDRRIAGLVARASYPVDRVDTHRELYLCSSCDVAYLADVPATRPSARVFFADLVGREPVGDHYRMTLSRFYSEYWRFLTLRDDVGEVSYGFPKHHRPGYTVYQVESDGLIFKTWRLGMPEPHFNVTYARVHDTEVTGKAGTRIPLQIVDNFSEVGLYQVHCQGEGPKEAPDTGNHVTFSVYRDGERSCLATFHQPPPSTGR